MTVAFRSTPFLLLFFLTSLMSTASLPRMAGVKLITAIQLRRKKKGWYEWKSRPSQEKKKQHAEVTPHQWFHHRENGASQRPWHYFPGRHLHRSQSTLLRFHSLPVNWAHFAQLSKSLWGQWVFHLGESEVRQALTSKIFLCKSHQNQSPTSFPVQIFIVNICKTIFFMLKEIPQEIYLHCNPEKSYICMWQGILPLSSPV